MKEKTLGSNTTKRTNGHPFNTNTPAANEPDQAGLIEWINQLPVALHAGLLTSPNIRSLIKLLQEVNPSQYFVLLKQSVKYKIFTFS